MWDPEETRDGWEHAHGLPRAESLFSGVPSQHLLRPLSLTRDQPMYKNRS